MLDVRGTGRRILVLGPPFSCPAYDVFFSAGGSISTLFPISGSKSTLVSFFSLLIVILGLIIRNFVLWRRKLYIYALWIECSVYRKKPVVRLTVVSVCHILKAGGEISNGNGKFLYLHRFTYVSCPL